MNRRRAVLTAAAAGLAGAIGVSGQGAQPPKTHLKSGDMAPDFELPSTAGGKVKLSDLRGKKNVVLAFFPAAFTGGCTKELTAYESGIAKFTEVNTQVYGISTDFTPSLKRFAEDLKTGIPLLSDHMRDVSKKYGILMENISLANRSTFLVDMEGKIVHIEEGSSAVNPEGALLACQRTKKKE